MYMYNIYNEIQYIIYIYSIYVYIYTHIYTYIYIVSSAGMQQGAQRATNPGRGRRRKTSRKTSQTAIAGQQKFSSRVVVQLYDKQVTDSDRRFAINAGLPFYSPEQFFLGSDPLALDPSFCPGLDPSSVPRTSASAYESIHLPEKGQEMVLSFFAWAQTHLYFSHFCVRPQVNSRAREGTGDGPRNFRVQGLLSAAVAWYGKICQGTDFREFVLGAFGGVSWLWQVVAGYRVQFSVQFSDLSPNTYQDFCQVLLVGSPGSGKSSLAKAVFQCKGYEWVNQDTLKTLEKCLEKTSKGLGFRVQGLGFRDYLHSLKTLDKCQNP